MPARAQLIGWKTKQENETFIYITPFVDMVVIAGAPVDGYEPTTKTVFQ